VPAGCTARQAGGGSQTAALQCEHTHTPEHRLAQQGGRLIKPDQRALLQCQQTVPHAAAAGSCCVNSWLGRLRRNSSSSKRRQCKERAVSGLVTAKLGVHCRSLEIDQGHSGAADTVSSMAESSKQLCVVGWCCCPSPWEAACARPSRVHAMYSWAFLRVTAHTAACCLGGWHCC
jgi:hypothetical protein